MKDFIVDAEGPEGLSCVFEDDGETGYLYLYNPGKREVVRHLHIYDRSPKIEVAPDDVRVVWSTDHQKCGVIIWGKIRGIIDVSSGREGRVWMESRDTPGIGDADWLNGF
jgi:hypothetical protein